MMIRDREEYRPRRRMMVMNVSVTAEEPAGISIRRQPEEDATFRFSHR